MTDLFHYTCRHGRRGIGTRGLVLTPRTHNPVAASAMSEYAWLATLAWFTTAEEPDPIHLGLTMSTIHCDRTRFRYRVTDTSDLRRWLDVCGDYPVAEVTRLNGGDHRPDLWWVSTTAVPVVFDPAWR